MRLLKLVPDNTNIGFVRLRHIAFGLTLLLTILAVSLVGARGLNLGVDFVGGLMIEAKFPARPSLDAVRSTVDGLGVGAASLQQFGDPNTVSMRLPPPSVRLIGRTQPAGAFSPRPNTRRRRSRVSASSSRLSSGSTLTGRPPSFCR